MSTWENSLETLSYIYLYKFSYNDTKKKKNPHNGSSAELGILYRCHLSLLVLDTLLHMLYLYICIIAL